MINKLLRIMQQLEYQEPAVRYSKPAKDEDRYEFYEQGLYLFAYNLKIPPFESNKDKKARQKRSGKRIKESLIQHVYVQGKYYKIEREMNRLKKAGITMKITPHFDEGDLQCNGGKPQLRLDFYKDGEMWFNYGVTETLIQDWFFKLRL